jgi:hypothetical protein
MTNLMKLPLSRKRRSPAPLLDLVDVGRVRAGRYVARSFALPISTALLTAEAAGFNVTGERGR